MKGQRRKCPECVRLGQRSILHIGATTTTLLATSRYYDEDGVYHENNPNTRGTEYWCSAGHRWTEAHRED